MPESEFRIDQRVKDAVLAQLKAEARAGRAESMVQWLQTDNEDYSTMLRAMARRLAEERRELPKDVKRKVAMLNAEDLVTEKARRYRAERERDELSARVAALTAALTDALAVLDAASKDAEDRSR